MSPFTDAWRSYTPMQKRNIGFYIAGIFGYKFALEFFNGSITTLATDRFNAANTFTKLGAASGLNQAMQCVGAILIAPLAARFATKNVLSTAVVIFGVMTTILLITDAATGGKVRQPGGKVQYGSWNPNAIFPIWGISGIAYGMVELIRRVIPADICGGDVLRLRRMDAIVHVLYEVAGTSAAFASSAAITRFGNNTSYFTSPVLFTLAGVAWFFITPTTRLHEKPSSELAELEHDGMRRGNYLKQVGTGAWDFVRSVYVGAKIIFTHRKFCWLFTAYSVALYLHRYLESGVGPAFARRVLNTSAWSQILVGGSNFGELLGALSVFLLATKIPTPIPWLRMDAMALNLIWAVPSIARIAVEKEVRWAWYVAALNIGISFGWAAGDVSLAAYIQSSLQSMHIAERGVSPLGAVMAFLYSGYIVLNAVLSTLLGRVIDKDWRENDNIFTALTQVGGIQFTVGSVIIFASTFIPRGALAINPSGDSGDLKTPQDDEADIESELPREGLDTLGKSKDLVRDGHGPSDDDYMKGVPPAKEQ